MIRLLERSIFPLFFLTAILGLVYWYWTTTPTYALGQIVASIKNKDTETFERYVDIESIVYKAIDDLLHGPARDSGMFGNLDNVVGVGLISLFKPELAEIARTQVLKFIEQGSLSDKVAELEASAGQPGTALAAEDTAKVQPVADGGPASSSDQSSITGVFKQRPEHKDTSFGRLSKNQKVQQQLKDYGLSKEGFKGVDYLKIEAKEALVGLKFHSPKLDRDYVIELKMEENAGVWKITSLSNLNDLVSLYLQTKDEIKSQTPVPLAIPDFVQYSSLYKWQTAG